MWIIVHQRIAIARGLFREHDIIVLDEPTSAIDPIEESRMYQDFKEISEGLSKLLKRAIFRKSTLSTAPLLLQI